MSRDSATPFAPVPYDLVAAAPGWLPWDDLIAVQSRDELGFVLWYAGGGWTRGQCLDPDGEPVDDGWYEAVRHLVNRAAVLEVMHFLLFEWGGLETGPGEVAARRLPPPPDNSSTGR
ncbi:hypothetical protein [Actinoplanes sp. NPDC051494]|uniref:hypothetical protein n=1 Tax=Actinoplanes sp. NPDC051494 TaxID=3363907 RepID=UPI0037908455